MAAAHNLRWCSVLVTCTPIRVAWIAQARSSVRSNVAAQLDIALQCALYAAPLDDQSGSSDKAVVDA
jgi:hypothetical protein